jgi:hypothetical protein
MKNVLMILFLLGGFAIASVDAQSCKPCPPGCCIISCCLNGKSGAAAAQKSADGTAAFASFSPEAMTATCEGKKMSKKDMKACQAICEAHSTAAPGDQTHVAPASFQGVATPAACQPGCKSSKEGKSSASAVPQSENRTAPVPAKG